MYYYIYLTDATAYGTMNVTVTHANGGSTCELIGLREMNGNNNKNEMEETEDAEIERLMSAGEANNGTNGVSRLSTPHVSQERSSKSIIDILYVD